MEIKWYQLPIFWVYVIREFLRGANFLKRGKKMPGQKWVKKKRDGHAGEKQDTRTVRIMPSIYPSRASEPTSNPHDISGEPDIPGGNRP